MRKKQSFFSAHPARIRAGQNPKNAPSCKKNPCATGPSAPAIPVSSVVHAEKRQILPCQEMNVRGHKHGKNLPTLPIGQADFSTLRKSGRLYVDKTALLTELIHEGDYYFLSRPRRFGKSLTISTPKAMFYGKHDLFQGLAADHWVREQSKHPSPVLHLDLSAFGDIENPEKQAWQKTPIFSLDFSTFDSNGSAKTLHHWLNRKILTFAKQYHVHVKAEDSSSETLDCGVLLIEISLALSTKSLLQSAVKGEQQIPDADYLEPYATGSLPVSLAVFVINA